MGAVREQVWQRHAAVMLLKKARSARAADLRYMMTPPLPQSSERMTALQPPEAFSIMTISAVEGALT